jgi:predicted ATP-binding protein involved in virulence
VVPPYIAKPLIEFYEKSIADNKQVIDKLNLFYDILVGSDFANKELQISPDFGFRFKANNKDRDIILPDMLSSGEKQIVLMTYEIVFKTIEGMLLLIDEPELSFHTIWQIDFLKNIKAISKLNDSQFIIATHLPQMFGSNWNLTQDLYELNEKK